MTTIPREKLQSLFHRLAFPSALQLRRAVIAREKARAARVPRPSDYQPWRSTIQDATEFVSKAGQRQILAKTQPFDGKIASGRLDQRWAADIISYVAQPAKTAEGLKQYILIVQDIFSREIWTRALSSMKAVKVAQAYKEILRESRRTPRELSRPC
jgi:transposase InsO family protein